MFGSAQKNHVCQLSSLMGGFVASIYKIFFIEIEWNIHICTENLFATHHYLWNEFLLEIEWNSQIWTEMLFSPKPLTLVWREDGC